MSMEMTSTAKVIARSLNILKDPTIHKPVVTGTLKMGDSVTVSTETCYGHNGKLYIKTDPFYENSGYVRMDGVRITSKFKGKRRKK